MDAYHKEVLTLGLAARKREITEYEVNIINFRLALERVGDDPDLKEFKSQLADLLASNLIEQKKAKIIHDVIALQLETENG